MNTDFELIAQVYAGSIIELLQFYEQDIFVMFFQANVLLKLDKENVDDNN